MTAQDDINNAVTVVTGLLSDIQARVTDANTQLGTLATDLTAIQQQIAAGQPVSTAALDTVVGNVAAAVVANTALTPYIVVEGLNSHANTATLDYIAVGGGVALT